jgi:hypothetical protein
MSNISPDSSNPTSPADSPVTMGTLQQVMSQWFQQITQQQQEMIQQQVASAVQSTSRKFPNSTSTSGHVDEAKSSSAFTNLPPKVKICQPSTFTGNPNRSVDLWLFEMNKYLQLCGVNNDDTKIALASGYFKDSALIWWRSLSSHGAYPTTWLVFCQVVKQRFQPLAASLTARVQLYALKQGTSSVVDHTTKFQNLVQLADDMNEKDQIYLFIRSLRPAISKEIDTTDFKTLHEAMTLAQRAETLLDNRRYYNSTTGFEPRTTTTSTFPYPSSASAPTSSPTDSSSSSTTMDLSNLNRQVQVVNQLEVEEKEAEYQRYVEEGDEYEPNYEIYNYEQLELAAADDAVEAEQLQVMQRRSNPFAKRMAATASPLSQEEWDRCMRERLCLRCKKPNHISRDCPQRRYPPHSAPRPSRRNF